MLKNRSLGTVLAMVCAIVFISASGLKAQGAQNKDAAQWNAVDAKIIKKLKESGQNDAEAYQKMGMSYLQQQVLDRAFLYFNAAVRINPEMYWSWYYMGLLSADDAETYFKRAIEANPRFAPARYWLGRFYMKKEHTQEAIKAFEGYLRVAESDRQEQIRVIEVQGVLEQLKNSASGVSK